MSGTKFPNVDSGSLIVAPSQKRRSQARRRQKEDHLQESVVESIGEEEVNNLVRDS